MAKRVIPVKNGKKEDPRQAVAETMWKLAGKDPRVVMIDADLAKCSGGTIFETKMPDKHINVGIAEQTLVGVAAGMALSGMIPFASSFCSFLTRRACDQICVSVAFNRANVKLLGSYSGLSQAKNGPTHISYEDIAITRSIPGIVVLAPTDTIELRRVLEFAYKHEGPVYIRMPRGPLTQILPDDYEFELGQGVILKEGKDATIVAIGVMVKEALEAAEELEGEGISVEVMAMPSIKPIDKDGLVETAKKTGLIITLEDHNIYGGLGEAVASTLAELYPTKVIRMGIPDKFGITVDLEYQLEHAGISKKHIAAKVKELIKKP